MDPGKIQMKLSKQLTENILRELSVKPAIARSHYTLKSNQLTVTMVRPKLLKPIKAVDDYTFIYKGTIIWENRIKIAC